MFLFINNNKINLQNTYKRIEHTNCQIKEGRQNGPQEMSEFCSLENTTSSHTNTFHNFINVLDNEQ